MTKISAIVPVYKVEKYLHRCIDSILAQTFSDFELILVDDGSPDGCPAICDETVLFDDRILSIHKPNEGVSVARNVAAEFSIGKYITFVDSDDWVETDMLCEMYNALIGSKSDMVICGYRFIDLDGSIVDSFTPKDTIKTNVEALEYYAKISNSVIHAPWCKLISRKSVLNNPFPRGRRYGEDFATVYKWMFDSDSVVSVEQIFYNYYYSETGISRHNVPWNENLITYNEINSFCKTHKLKELQKLFAMDRIDSDYWGHEQTNDIEMKRLLRNDAKKFLVKYACSISYFPSNKLEIYEMIFPAPMKVYCHFAAMKRMLKEKGIACTIQRIFGGER